MARFGLALTFLLIGYIAYILYLDAQSEQQVYEFCNRWSPTNPISEVTRNIDDQFVFNDDKSNNVLLITKSAQLPLQSSYSCQIEYSQQRIVSLAVLKQ